MCTISAFARSHSALFYSIPSLLGTGFSPLFKDVRRERGVWVVNMSRFFSVPPLPLSFPRLMEFLVGPGFLSVAFSPDFLFKGLLSSRLRLSIHVAYCLGTMYYCCLWAGWLGGAFLFLNLFMRGVAQTFDENECWVFEPLSALKLVAWRWLRCMARRKIYHNALLISICALLG